MISLWIRSLLRRRSIRHVAVAVALAGSAAHAQPAAPSAASPPPRTVLTKPLAASSAAVPAPSSAPTYSPPSPVADDAAVPTMIRAVPVARASLPTLVGLAAVGSRDLGFESVTAASRAALASPIREFI